MGKVRLNILGLSYSQSQAGAYALVLAEENGSRRLPIIIGATEAQSIAIKLESLKPFRPLTHDLFFKFAEEFGIQIKEVLIYKLEEGIFYSELHCVGGEKEIIIDSRTSDAVALSLRFNCPLFVLDQIIDKAGILIDEDQETSEVGENETTTEMEEIGVPELMDKTEEELDIMLEEAIKSENYEEASLIRDELGRREP